MSYLKISLYVLAVIILAILFEKVIGNINIIWDQVTTFFKFISNILSPFIYGFFIAYCINPVVRFAEKKIFIKIKFLDNRQKLKRFVSIIVTYIIFIGLTIWLIAYLVPEIIGNIRNLITTVYNNYPLISQTIEDFIEQYDLIPSYMSENIIQTISKPLWEMSSSITNLVNQIVLSMVGLAGILLNIVLGLMISFYMLSEKERFGKQIKKLLYVIFSHKISGKIILLAEESNNYFEKFIIGKALDSTIIGILCFIILTIIKAPYTLILSLIVGVTNMIPYFGPFIGAIPAVLITLFVSPKNALWVAVAIFLLQQFDGIVLGPKILGDSTGLNPFWVIFAILAGGAMFGVLGMFLGVPFFALINAIISRLVNIKYEAKKDMQKKLEGMD